VKIKSSLYQTFLVSVIGTSLLMAVGIGCFWIKGEYREFNEDALMLRDLYISDQKNKIKNVVDQVIQYVKFRRAITEEDWRDNVKGRVDAEKDLQKEVLDFINTIRFDGDNYVYVYDFKGTALAHYKPETIGKSLWGYIDPNGVPVAQELIRISQQPEGGFLQYVGTVKPETGKPSAKIGYARSIPEWRWMIGAGVYVDDVERVLEKKHDDLQRKIKNHILRGAVGLLLAFIAIICFTRKVSSRLRRSVEAFTLFFEKAAIEAVPMDEESVHYTEFKHLVAPANRMLQERNKAQQALKESEERLNRAKKMEALGLLAGGVAHDLNNVLSGIVSYPDLLLETLPPESPLRRPLSTIRDSGNKAAAIVQDLLTLARRGVVSCEVINLNRIITEYLISPEHKNLLAQFPLTTVETRLDPDLLNIKGSDVHLRKSLMNLVSNAFESQPDGGRVLVSTSNRYLDEAVKGYETIGPGDYVLMCVEDSGTGIPADDIKRIFEPFYTKKVMGRHSGTGLGMAIVWGTLRDHQGYIDVKSNDGKGTLFELYFPVTREDPVPIETDVSVDDLMGAGEHILVVDDILEQRLIAESLLTRLGYQVTTVESGEMAVEYLRSNRVDLLLLDMIMEPGMDGLDTYRRIIEMYPGQKALIASGYTETDQVREAQQLGAGRYLKKPYTLKGLGLAVYLELGGGQAQLNKNYISSSSFPNEKIADEK
jgi:signal transduction histidine kinase/ActR/RegA family two-component response regulator